MQERNRHRVQGRDLQWEEDLDLQEASNAGERVIEMGYKDSNTIIEKLKEKIELMREVIIKFINATDLDWAKRNELQEKLDEIGKE